MTLELAYRVVCSGLAGALLAVVIVFAIEGVIWTLRALFNAAQEMWNDPE